MTDNQEPALLPPPSGMNRWFRYMMLFLIFFCGCVVGTLIGSFSTRERMITMMQHPEQVPNRIFPRIRSTLELDDNQAQLVEAVVRKRYAVMEALRAESYPQQLTEFKAMQSEISELLSPEQQSQWALMCETIENRFLPARPIGPPPAELLFERFDFNTDGAIKEAETPARMWQRLRSADLNGDGQVTRDEYMKAQSGVK